MALKVFQRNIQDSSSTGGTGTLVMQSQKGDPLPEHLGNVCADQDSTVLCITDLAGNYEVSQCLVSVALGAGGVTIARTAVLASSNTVNNVPSQVNFPAGTQKITNFIPGGLAQILFNFQYQVSIAGALNQMAADISDLKDAMSLLLDGGAQT